MKKRYKLKNWVITGIYSFIAIITLDSLSPTGLKGEDKGRNYYGSF